MEETVLKTRKTMKTTNVIAAFALMVLMAFASESLRAQTGKVNPEKIYTTSELTVQPSYSDEYVQSVDEFITRNLAYPRQAMENGTEGTVKVRAVIEADGRVSDVLVLDDIGDYCGDMAAKLVWKTRKWTPGEVNGKPVRSEVFVEVRFELK